jgi:hypothetical protein
MIYTQKSPALLIMGAIFVAIAVAAGSGAMDGLIGYLSAKKYAGEMIGMGYAFGAIGVLIGAWALWGTHREGNMDYYLSTVAGAIFILLIAMLVRWYLAPLVAVASKAIGPVMGAKYLHQVLGLNYVVLGILAGIITVNVFGIPAWAENGVRLSRLGLKTGVILLGTLYSLGELAALGRLSVVMVGFFVLGSVAMVLWLGRRRKIPNSMGGVLSAGMGRDRLYHRHHPDLGRRVHVPVPGDRARAGSGSYPVRRLGRNRHLELGAGRRRCLGLSAGRHRDSEGRGNIQYHPRSVPADHRSLAGSLVRAWPGSGGGP